MTREQAQQEADRAARNTGAPHKAVKFKGAGGYEVLTEEEAKMYVEAGTAEYA